MNAQTNPTRDVRIRVVVADDHPVVRGMVRSALQRHPHFEVCGEAENGAEAIEEVKRVRPDVVVLNVTMPLVNGFQAHERSRSRSQKPQLSFCRRMRISILLRKLRRLVCEPMFRNQRSDKPSSKL